MATKAATKTAVKPTAAAKKTSPTTKTAPPAKTATTAKLAQAADKMYAAQQRRYVLNREVEALKKEEEVHRQYLIDNLPKSQSTGIAGKLARATVESKTVPQLKDFDKLMAYVASNYKKKPGVAALLQRRVSDGTVNEMWEAGQEVPGVEPFDIPVVRLNKV